MNDANRKDIDEVIDILRDFMGQVSDKFDAVSVRFDKIDQQFTEINRKLEVQNEKYDHLLNTIDGFVSRIDRYETELAVRDNQFERLLAWARKVSEKNRHTPRKSVTA